MVDKISKEFYEDIIRPNISYRQDMIVKSLLRAKRPVTNSEIAKNLNLPVNCVTGRIKELRDLGFVKGAGKRYCTVIKTGKMVNSWYLTENTITNQPAGIYSE